MTQHQLHRVLCVVTELKIPVPGDRAWTASAGAQAHLLPEKDLPQDKKEVPYPKE